MSFEDTTFTENPEISHDDHAVRYADVVGVDSEGFEHRFSRPRNEVYLLTGDQVAIKQTLGTTRETDLTAWIAYVREKVGWEECHYAEADSVGEWLTTHTPVKEAR